jgi:hypothetical protein
MTGGRQVRKIRSIAVAVGTSLAVVVLLTSTAMAQQMPQTTTEKTAGAASAVTQELKGEVLYVEGNDLVVKTSTGEIRTFHVPETRRFIVDGKELTVHQLQTGTTLTAKVTTTTTPVTVRTTTVGSGTVWYVMGNTVILTLPNGENRQYTTNDAMKFTIDGQPADASALRKGMKVSAAKIVEEPHVEIAVDTKVVGHAPMASAASASAASSASSSSASAAPAAAAAPAATSLPKTASPWPLVGLLGLLSLGASFGIRVLCRP